MNSQLIALLPQLVPLAAQWAAKQELRILQDGVPLSSVSLADARLIGVEFPERIRLLKIDAIPVPEDPILAQAAAVAELLTPATAGLTIRHGIFIRSDCWNDRRLIAHECAHTAQYERMGGIEQFLAQYLRECIEIGYPAAPMEQEAVEAENLIGE
ncbi:hypothetical protein [Luteolibacter soli]|uniref:DUF4157 domain-containing protein n=1 Tax=Luteolibacter soli TaxID=3135280 RepID=A0ABU9B0A4_9BACT